MQEFGGRPEDIRGLAAEEYVTRLRETLLPLAERFHRLGSEAVGAQAAATNSFGRG
jgi:hypothetical protein